MSNKTKSYDIFSKAQEAAANAGLVLMSGAVTLGLVEVPHHPDKRAVLPPAPQFATAPALSHAGEGEMVKSTEMRREKEEVHPHAASYSSNQRTPARSGRV